MHLPIIGAAAQVILAHGAEGNRQLSIPGEVMALHGCSSSYQLIRRPQLGPNLLAAACMQSLQRCS